jgi:hypothetical protein
MVILTRLYVRGVMSDGAAATRRNFELFLEKYSEALCLFGSCPLPFVEGDDSSVIMKWMMTEFESLPGVISSASDFAAIFSTRSLLKLLELHDCANLQKFRAEVLNFPNTKCFSYLR